MVKEINSNWNIIRNFEQYNWAQSFWLQLIFQKYFHDFNSRCAYAIFPTNYSNCPFLIYNNYILMQRRIWNEQRETGKRVIRCNNRVPFSTKISLLSSEFWCKFPIFNNWKSLSFDNTQLEIKSYFFFPFIFFFVLFSFLFFQNKITDSNIEEYFFHDWWYCIQSINKSCRWNTLCYVTNFYPLFIHLD